MARALTIKRAIVTKSDRAVYLDRLRARRDHYKRAGCQFWVFEEIGLPGAFIEFTEASDAGVLAAAHAAAAEQPLDASRIYREVELS